MFSYILLLLSSIIFLYPYKSKFEGDNFSLIFVSLSFSHFFLGTISLILVLLNYSRFPILIIASAVFIISVYSLNIYKKNELSFYYQNLIENFNINFNDLKNNSKNKFFYIISILLILIFLSSIGPINHPDAADYHLGYPYQYFLRGGFFVDGGFHQGLLGIGDYANLAFLQEKTTWFIRPMQIISLPALTIYLNKKIHKKIFILIILSCPLLIQWSTIGKPLFLSESCLVCLYLQWVDKKNYINFKYLLISFIVCICTKISSLIIALPIIIHLTINLYSRPNIKSNLFFYLRRILLDRIILLMFSSLCLLLYSRYLINGNFAFPLLTNTFNSENILINIFANYLRTFGRDGYFPLDIFFPFNMSGVSISLGFPISLLILFVFFIKIKNFKKLFNNSIINVFFAQIILLISFCQGRGYYYLVPIILVISQLDSFRPEVESLNRKLIKIFLFSILVQLLITFCFVFVSIFQNINGIIDYENFMNNTAYGYSSSKLLKENSFGKTLFITRNTRLFYDTNYIDQHLFRVCMMNNNYKGKIESQNVCLDKLNIVSIISEVDAFNLDKENLSCSSFKNVETGRNIFLRRKTKYFICKVKN